MTNVPEALEALRAGKPIVVLDDRNRENEADIIMAAQFATEQLVAWTIRHTSGFLCAPLSNKRADALLLPAMVRDNEDRFETAYTVSVDAAHPSVTTGISAADRSLTLRTLASPNCSAADFIRPGHILPLRARNGGLRERAGHTEAAIELMHLAGLYPVGVIAELVADSGELLRDHALQNFVQRNNLVLVEISEILQYMDAHAPQVSTTIPRRNSECHFEIATSLPTKFGNLEIRGYRDDKNNEHIALIAQPAKSENVLVRVHSECITGEVFRSLKCDCHDQLYKALDLISAKGGAVIYMRGHEGRGIGIMNKLRAYSLQERGLDTFDSNLELGLPVDARDYCAAADILRDLGVKSVRLLSNNPEKQRQLQACGIRVVEMVPWQVGLDERNQGYLEVKRDRMGHRIDL